MKASRESGKNFSTLFAEFYTEFTRLYFEGYVKMLPYFSTVDDIVLGDPVIFEDTVKEEIEKENSKLLYRHTNDLLRRNENDKR